MANTSKKDYVVWMSFEANVCIRAESMDDALAEAHALLDARSVFRDEDVEEFGKKAVHDDRFYPQEPHVVEEHHVKEES